MNILFCCQGSLGDLFPMLAIAGSCKALGHSVSMLASERHKAWIDCNDVPFHAWKNSEQQENILPDPGIPGPIKSFAVYVRRVVIPGAFSLFHFVKGMPHRPDMIVAQTMALGARMVQEKLGIPLVTVHLQPFFLRSRYAKVFLPGCRMPSSFSSVIKPVQYLLVDFFIDRMLEPVNGFRKELGLPPVRRWLDTWIHSPYKVLGLFPPWFAGQQTEWPSNVLLSGFPLYDGTNCRPLPKGVLDFINKGESPIIFSSGSFAPCAKKYLQEAQQVCKSTGKRAIVIDYWSSFEGLSDKNICCVKFAPFSEFLKYGAAIIHHGGIGSVAHSFAAGIPQVIVPFSFDQPDNARRVAGLGAGRMISARKFSAKTIAQAIDMTSAAPFKSRCMELSRQIVPGQAEEKAAQFITG